MSNAPSTVLDLPSVAFSAMAKALRLKNKAHISQKTASTLLTEHEPKLGPGIWVGPNSMLLRALSFGSVRMPKGKKLIDRIHIHDQVKFLRALAGLGEGGRDMLDLRFNRAAERTVPNYVGVTLKLERKPHGILVAFEEAKLETNPEGSLAQNLLRAFAEADPKDGKGLAGMSDLLRMAAQIEAGLYPLNGERIDVTTLVRECVSALQARAETKAIHLTLRLPQNVCAIIADTTVVSQIITRLLRDAIDAAPHRGCVGVEVIAERAPDGFAIRVTDTGNASSNEQIDLGRKVARSLAELHCGSMTINSDPTFGTSIEVRFGQIDAQNTRQDSVNDNLVEHRQVTRHQVLDVDRLFERKAG